MSDQPVIRTRRLTRYFGRKRAVYELDLEGPQGSVFAFLGRNGSGKTTTIRMLLGLLQPTRGEAHILGHDSRAVPPEARARIGYLTEEHQLYAWMTVYQAADFQSRFYPRWSDKVKIPPGQHPFNYLARGVTFVAVDFGEGKQRPAVWPLQHWDASSGTIWFYWTKYGRLVGFDLLSRRLIGRLGPDGFSAGNSKEWPPLQRRLTANALYAHRRLSSRSHYPHGKTPIRHHG